MSRRRIAPLAVLLAVAVGCSSLSSSGQGGDTAGLTEQRTLFVAFVDSDGGDRATEVRQGADLRLSAFNGRDPIIEVNFVDAGDANAENAELVAALVVGDDLSGAEEFRGAGVPLIVVSSQAILGDGAWRVVAGPSALADAASGIGSDVSGEDAVFDASDGAQVLCACAAVTGEESGVAGEFVEGYQAEYGGAPRPWSAEGYDAIGLVVEAVRLSVLDRMGVASYLTSLPTPFFGVTKGMRFTPDGELRTAPVFLLESAGGQLTLVETIEVEG